MQYIAFFGPRLSGETACTDVTPNGCIDLHFKGSKGKAVAWTMSVPEPRGSMKDVAHRVHAEMIHVNESGRTWLIYMRYDTEQDYFLDQTTYICTNCKVGCLTCSSATVCIACMLNYATTKGFMCIITSCTACSATSTCKTCDETIAASNCICDAGKYWLGTVCTQCDSNCATCKSIAASGQHMHWCEVKRGVRELGDIVDELREVAG